jgi:hypothetical protein
MLAKDRIILISSVKWQLDQGSLVSLQNKINPYQYQTLDGLTRRKH